MIILVYNLVMDVCIIIFIHPWGGLEHLVETSEG